MGVQTLTGSAIYSPCKKYRYTLTREWEFMGDIPDKGRLTFVMLNPSTATAETVDATVRGCLTRAKTWGFTSLSVVNIFAWRSTDPKVLRTLEDPVGFENDAHILEQARRGTVICAWGTATPLAHARGKSVTALLQGAGVKMHYLKLNKDGTPAHPLYLAFNNLPKVWTP